MGKEPKVKSKTSMWTTIRQKRYRVAVIDSNRRVLIEGPRVGWKSRSERIEVAKKDIPELVQMLIQVFREKTN